MKSVFKSALLLVSGAVFSALPAMAVTTTNGDLLVGFYQVNAGNVQPNTYVFNLGQASLYRENTLTHVSVSTVNSGISSNIGTDLVAAFGANWATDGTVKWGIVGGLDQTTVGLVGGDTLGTSYISRESSITVAMSSAQPAITGGFRPTLASNIEAFRGGSNGTGTAGTNPAGSTITVNTSLATFEDFLPPTQAASQFGLTQNILGEFISVDGGNVGALDVWRLIGGTSTSQVNASGADFTSGLDSSAVQLGRGQYIGTIAIDGAGNLSIIPEPSSTLLLGVFGILGLTFRKRSNA